MQNIENAVLKMCKFNFAMKKDEKILVMSDYFKSRKDFKKRFNATEKDAKGVMSALRLAKEVYSIIRKKYHNTDFLAYEATGSNGRGPDKGTARKMIGYGSIIILSHYSMTHTDARQKANKAGAKIASMPGFQRQMFFKYGPMDQDYSKIKSLSEKISKKLTKSKKVFIAAANGTKLDLLLGNESLADTGLIKRGKFSNLPAGEAYVVPRGGNGILVINKGWYKGIKKDLTLKFKGGVLVDIKGGGDIGKRVKKKLFEKKHRRMLAELGIGTNPGAGNPTNVLESEKIKGTIHIAFGDSSHMPNGKNKSDSHIDFILDRPTVVLDEKVIIDNGNVKL